MSDLLQSKLNGMTRKQKLDLIQVLVAHEGKLTTADEFRAFVVGGVIGKCINAMSDPAFKQFCTVHRCGAPDCDCHVIAEAAAAFFKLLREDMQKEFSRRSQRRN